MNSLPIGVFDSGIGGLTVMKELLHTLPNEHFIYLGDTARLPYGEKSRDTIIRYSIENADFLLEKGIKILVIACNTASAHALEELQQRFQVPVIGVILPSAAKVVQLSKKGRIGILGTKGTIQSEVYQKAINQLSPQAFVLPVACPLLVPLVEENYGNHPATHLIVQEYLKPFRNNNIDTVLLGCTHYPLLKNVIQDVLGSDVIIVDSAAACAENIKTVLFDLNLQAPASELSVSKYFVSDDPQKFQLLGKTLLNLEIFPFKKDF